MAVSIENTRTDNHREPLLRFSVKRRSDLVGVVVPFFEAHPLRTAKQLDFERFAADPAIDAGRRAPDGGRASVDRSG